MNQTVIERGTWAVVISQYAERSLSARVYVDYHGSIANAIAGHSCSKFKTMAGAKRWAEKILAKKG